MRFGIFDYVEIGSESMARVYDDRMEFVRAVEEAGFYGYYVSEHHFTPISSTPSPTVYLSAVARETKRIRIGALLFLLPLYHPLRLAEELCMLDHLSRGRLDIGVGRGIAPDEFAALGEDHAVSTEVYNEALEVLVKALTQDTVDHAGKKWTFRDVPMVMSPLQKPYPPLWYGLHGEVGGIFAARHGMNAMASGLTERVAKHLSSFRAAWNEHASERLAFGSPVKEPIVGAARIVFVGETDEEAGRIARAAYTKWFENLGWIWRRNGRPPAAGFSGDYDAARQTGWVVAGSPETVRRELLAQAETCGFDYLVMVMNFGSLTHAQALHSLGLFRREVMPALQHLGSDAAFAVKAA